MEKRIDVFGHYFVMFTDKCASKWGTTPPVHVANLYALWLDWEGTGKPNNPEVFAQLAGKTNATMVMFQKDGNKAMDKFFDKYGFDEDPGPSGSKGWFHPHDVGCDETPHGDPDDKNSYDNAQCEVAMEKNIGDCGYAYDHIAAGADSLPF
eukprot:gene714-13660_t